MRPDTQPAAGVRVLTGLLMGEQYERIVQSVLNDRILESTVQVHATYESFVQVHGLSSSSSAN